MRGLFLWLLNICMKFRIKTLVDVTETKARRGENQLLAKQQANFMTLANTIGLRTNPSDFAVESKKEDVSKLFGSAHRGKKTVWTVNFSVEADESLSVDMMIEDFDLIPFIAGLTEDAKFASNVFRTQDPEHANIIFECLDK